jgi:hypothetical protein
MIRKACYTGLGIIIFLLFHSNLAAQKTPKKEKDTFFLAKKKGLLGRLGKSISTTPDEAPAQVSNPYRKYKGKIIRSISTISLGFEYDINDTTHVKSNFGVKVGKFLHKNTSSKVIENNLFFKTGQPLFPYLLADNERYLRDIVYIKDAKIVVEPAEGSTDSVDVIVITKDVFSIGGRLSFSGLETGRAEIREENFLGSGTRLLLSGYYEKIRFPQKAIGAELIRRNIGGTFIDWVSGYQDYRDALTTGRKQETTIYTRIEKPLVTPYIPSTGALEWSYQRTRNVYDIDTIYRRTIRYAYYNLDAWFGYSLDNRRALYENKEIRVHRFLAIRAFSQHFIEKPARYKDTFDYRFTNSKGLLASLNIFKQTFYKTNFIYGFGRTEDIPEGFSAAVIAGYSVRQNEGYEIKGEIKRPYAGFDASLANVKTRGLYNNYTFRIGGFYYRHRFEDIDILLNLEHFTRLRKMSRNWYQRTFINTGVTVQANPALNTPLFLNSTYGLLYFNNGNIASDLRATFKGESVFYNTKKLLGFRFAPFVFADLSLLKPVKMGLQHSDLFSAVGGGVRTRNENLVFGTIELKGYYFPRTVADMRAWKVELKSSIRFRYRSSFISRPDFIVNN